MPLPPSFQAAVAAAAAAGEGGSGGGTPEDFIDFLRKQAVSYVEPWAASLALRLQDCSIAGATLALLYTGASWWALLVQYKATVLGLRRGVGRESGLGPAVRGGHDTPSKAVGFVGVQAAGSALALLLCAAAFTALLFALTTAWVQAWLRSLFADVLVVLLSTGFLIRVLKFLLFEMTMTADGSIHLRRAFSGLEVYFGFVSVISGVILAVARLPLAFAAFLGTLMRPDVHVTAFNLRLDPAVKTYGALLAMDARFSNPFHIVAARLLQDALREARARREAAAAAAAAATGAACRLGEDGVVVAVSNVRSAAHQEAGRAGLLYSPHHTHTPLLDSPLFQLSLPRTARCRPLPPLPPCVSPWQSGAAGRARRPGQSRPPARLRRAAPCAGGCWRATGGGWRWCCSRTRSSRSTACGAWCTSTSRTSTAWGRQCTTTQQASCAETFFFQ